MRQIDHFDAPSGHREQEIQGAEPETGGTVLVLNHDNRERSISEQREKLLAVVVKTGANLFDHPVNLIAFGRAAVQHPLHLPVQVRLLLE